MKPALFVLLWSLLTPWQSAAASQCQMAFEHGVLISPEQIRILVQDRTQYQVNFDNQLFIQGELQQLSPDDQQVLKKYSHGLRKVVPQVVGIAVDSVELGLSTIENLLVGVGSSSQQEEWQALMRESTYQLMARFIRSGEHFYLAPQSLHEMDAFLHGELRENLNKLAKNTVGAVWLALRDALRHTDDNFERTDSGDLQPVEQLVNKINAGLDAKAEELESKSALFCQRLQELDKIETELQQRVPGLARFDVVTKK